MRLTPTPTPSGRETKVVIEPPKQVGAVARTGGLVLVQLVGGAGFLRSAEGYPIALDAVIEHGADYIRVDPDHGHVRLDTLTTLTDKKTGGLVRLHYTGVIPMSGPAGKVLSGASDAKTTDFGEAGEFLLPPACLPT